MVTAPAPTATSNADALVKVRALGGFEVSVAGRAVTHTDWQRVSAERLFKLLVVTPSHRLSRELAAETLWPDTAPDAGRARLRKAVHYVGLALDGQGLRATRTWVGLDADALDLDLDRLEAAMGQVVADHPRSQLDESSATRARATQTIVELGGGELLPDDPYEDWIVGPRERLTARWQRVALTAARRARDRGQSSLAHEIVGQLLQRDRTDEAAHRLAIELYAAEGRHHAARRQLEECRRALRDELDVEPAAETLALLDVVAATASAARAATSPPLVSRRVELECLEPVLDRVANGRLSTLVLHGPVGVGKTRLLEEVAAYARTAGWRSLTWQAVRGGKTMAYAPLRVSLATWLDVTEVASWPATPRRGLAALIPGLGATPDSTFDTRDALVTALVAVLGQLALPAPLLVTLDDVLWLDPASLELLAAAVAGLTDRRILVAAAYRDDEPIPEPVQRLLDQCRQAGGSELSVQPLALRDLAPLVLGHLGGTTLKPDLARRLYEHSAGNPLFCLELARAGREDGSITLVDGAWRIGAAEPRVPESVRRLVNDRLSRLPSAVRDLLVVASELGPEIGFETLGDVLHVAEGDLLATLDGALASRLLIEQGVGYAYAHPLYRCAVFDSVSVRRAGTTCLAIAEVLAGVKAGDPPAQLNGAARSCDDPELIAEHALAAAELGISRAAPMAVAYAFAAGGRCLQVFDHAGARSLLSRGLAAHKRLPPASQQLFDVGTALLQLAASDSGRPAGHNGRRNGSGTLDAEDGGCGDPGADSRLPVLRGPTVVEMA